MIIDKLQKQLQDSNSFIERNFAIKILYSFKCIKCGYITENSDDIFGHLIHCSRRENENI